MGNGWFDDDYSLLADFENMLNDDNDSSSSTKKDYKTCFHVWVEVGRSPVIDTPWINCKKCNMRKEDYDEHKKTGRK